MNKILNYIKLYGLMVFFNLKARSIYRANFILSIVQQLISAFVAIATIWIVLERFKDINGWNIYEIGFMLGLVKITLAINAIVFSTLWVVDMLINMGELDRLLLKPKSPMFLLACQRFDIMWIGEVITALIILWYTGSRTHVEWNLINVLYVVLIIICSSIVLASMNLITGLLSFWFLKSGSVKDFISVTYNTFTTYPLSIYGKRIQFILTFILPFGFMYYYPLLHIFNKSDPLLPQWVAFCSPLVTLGVVGAVAIVWYAGLRAYKSAGS